MVDRHPVDQVIPETIREFQRQRGVDGFYLEHEAFQHIDLKASCDSQFLQFIQPILRRMVTLDQHIVFPVVLVLRNGGGGVFGNPVRRFALNEQFVYLPNDLRLLWHDLRQSVRPLAVAEEGICTAATPSRPQSICAGPM